MDLSSRPFQNEGDLAAMRRLLVQGRQAANGTYYVHAGDLTWWYSYYTPDLDPRRFTTLWEDPAVPGGLAGWSLFSPSWHSLDVFVHPALRGAPQAAAMWTQAEETAIAQYRDAGLAKIITLWIAESDGWTVNRLVSRGFTRTEDYTLIMVRSLSDPVSEPSLPPGYVIRSPQGEAESALRAAPQHAAFQSDLPLDVYFARYARFMRSPGYTAGIDSMVVAGDGRAAAFCIVWPDEINRVGLFEPVGVHPDFHRQGFGRAIVTAGFRRLQACGMQSAMVCGLSHLPQACAFYESMGFQPALKLWTFKKELE